MELNIETMSLSDLKQIKSILTERLKKKEKWMVGERGRNYEEYWRRELIYYQDENHEKQDTFSLGQLQFIFHKFSLLLHPSLILRESITLSSLQKFLILSNQKKLPNRSIC